MRAGIYQPMSDLPFILAKQNTSIFTYLEVNFTAFQFEIKSDYCKQSNVILQRISIDHEVLRWKLVSRMTVGFRVCTILILSWVVLLYSLPPWMFNCYYMDYITLCWYELYIASRFLVKLPSAECPKTPLIIRQHWHYNDFIMSAIASEITSLMIVYSTVYSVADQRKHQSSTSLAFVRGSHLGPVNSPHKWPVTRKMFPFDDVIMDNVMLTHWGRDKMDAIFQTTFSNAFLWMKTYEFRLRFHWSLFARFQLTIIQLWFR